jgi:hypothetical protein
LGLNLGIAARVEVKNIIPTKIEGALKRSLFDFSN